MPFMSQKTSLLLGVLTLSLLTIPLGSPLAEVGDWESELEDALEPIPEKELRITGHEMELTVHLASITEYIHIHTLSLENPFFEGCHNWDDLKRTGDRRNSSTLHCLLKDNAIHNPKTGENLRDLKQNLESLDLQVPSEEYSLSELDEIKDRKRVSHKLSKELDKEVVQFLGTDFLNDQKKDIRPVQETVASEVADFLTYVERASLKREDVKIKDLIVPGEEFFYAIPQTPFIKIFISMKVEGPKTAVQNYVELLIEGSEDFIIIEKVDSMDTSSDTEPSESEVIISKVLAANLSVNRTGGEESDDDKQQGDLEEIMTKGLPYSVLGGVVVGIIFSPAIMMFWMGITAVRRSRFGPEEGNLSRIRFEGVPAKLIGYINIVLGIMATAFLLMMITGHL